jgi:hypothetical protein
MLKTFQMKISALENDRQRQASPPGNVLQNILAGNFCHLIYWKS